MSDFLLSCETLFGIILVCLGIILLVIAGAAALFWAALGLKFTVKQVAADSRDIDRDLTYKRIDG